MRDGFPLFGYSRLMRDGFVCLLFIIWFNCLLQQNQKGLIQISYLYQPFGMPH